VTGLNVWWGIGRLWLSVAAVVGCGERPALRGDFICVQSVHGGTSARMILFDNCRSAPFGVLRRQYGAYAHMLKGINYHPGTVCERHQHMDWRVLDEVGRELLERLGSLQPV